MDNYNKYFQRVFLPASEILAGLVGFGVTLLLFGFGVLPGTHILFLPTSFFAVDKQSSTEIVALSALSVDFRDVKPVRVSLYKQ